MREGALLVTCSWVAVYLEKSVSVCRCQSAVLACLVSGESMASETGAAGAVWTVVRLELESSFTRPATSAVCSRHADKHADTQNRTGEERQPDSVPRRLPVNSVSAVSHGKWPRRSRANGSVSTVSPPGETELTDQSQQSVQTPQRGHTFVLSRNISRFEQIYTFTRTTDFSFNDLKPKQIYHKSYTRGRIGCG